jgi:hypothetical protein
MLSVILVDNAMYRKLLLDFIVANNLALQIVDTPKYQALVSISKTREFSINQLFIYTNNKGL